MALHHLPPSFQKKAFPSSRYVLRLENKTFHANLLTGSSYSTPVLPFDSFMLKVYQRINIYTYVRGARGSQTQGGTLNITLEFF